MITISHVFSKGRVFVSYPETIEEEKQLQTLVQEVTMICKMTKNTGLWIVTEFEVDSKKAVAMSLKEKVEITDTDISLLHAGVVVEISKKVVKINQ